jgi:hypothetical protein
VRLRISAREQARITNGYRRIRGFSDLIINIIVGYEEETIEFLWGYVKKKVKPFYS